VYLREAVVYRGLEGPDAGRWFICSPADFVAKFVPVAQPAPTNGVPS